MLKMLPILAVLPVLAIIGTLAVSSFEIKHIQTTGDNNCVDTDYIKRSKILLGQNLLIFSNSGLVQNLKQEFPCVLGVTTEKSYPNTLKVTIKTKLLIARIDGTTLAISSENVLVRSTDSALPVVFSQALTPLKENAEIKEPSLLFVSKILAQLKDSDFAVSSIRVIDPTNIIVYNRENALAIFSAEGDLNRQVSSLHEVLAKSRIDATKIEKIDLRFDKPVLVYK